MLFYTHDDCLRHEMQRGHPERPDRLRAVNQSLSACGLMDRFECRAAQPIEAECLAAVHAPAYVAKLNSVSPASGLVRLDPDTAMSPGTLRAAALAAGAVTGAVQAVLDGVDKTAFCAVRPPGHHAEAGAAMGFCYYNSIALGAVEALKQVDRVAILDFDVHHGNGTVDAFKDHPEALVCSSFQHPFYPYRYVDIDAPNIVNTPLSAGTDGAAFRRAIERDWVPAVNAHRPDLILVSAGFDAHRDDPLGGLLLDDEDFRWITEFIVDLAETHAGGRVVSALEGGYDLAALGRCAVLHAEALSAFEPLLPLKGK
ncbi:MAG: histone deacetylase family protein [Gammaproteobacteria bacterium]|nr:histone deacetylase family protein [Gammaproteobacteria bacterium]